MSPLSICSVFLLLSLTTAISLPFISRQVSSRGLCPSSSSHTCRNVDSCCPNNLCCPPRFPLCYEGSCIDAEGMTACPSAADSEKNIAGLLCTSNTAHCCVRPFGFCSSSSPVTCVNEEGYVGCVDASTGKKSPGVLCPDNSCCINPSKCCLKGDLYACCPEGTEDGKLEKAPPAQGQSGSTPVPFTPSPSPQTPSSVPSPDVTPIEPGVPSVEPTITPVESDAPTVPDEPHTNVVDSPDPMEMSISPLPETPSEEEDLALESPEDDGSVCLPADAKVEVLGSGFVNVDSVQTGDLVRVGGGGFSRVFMWTHRDGTYAGRRYVKVLGSDMELTVTEGHMVYVCRGMEKECGKEAVIVDSVKVGDGMWKVSGENEWISEVSEVRTGVWGRGLYNPQTEQGDVVVDGVVVSCYTKYVPMRAAHALLAPLRAMFEIGMSVVEEL